MPEMPNTDLPIQTEDEWFADHPRLDREWWLGCNHDTCTGYWSAHINPNAPAYQQCHSMHCPRCNRPTGGQGHYQCKADIVPLKPFPPPSEPGVGIEGVDY